MNTPPPTVTSTIADGKLSIQLSGVLPIGSARPLLSKQVLDEVRRHGTSIRSLLLDFTDARYEWGDSPAAIVVECAAKKIPIEIVTGRHSHDALVRLFHEMRIPAELYSIHEAQP